MNSFTKGVEDQSYPQLDLSGKLIIKAQLGDDVRRIPIHNEAITYDELVLMMQRVFRGKLSSSDDIVIKYKDEDGDLITIFDSSDLAFAVQYSRILKLQILVGGENAGQNWGGPPANVGVIRRELQHIRDQVNHLLDSLEPRAVEVTSSTAENRSAQSDRSNATSHLSSREFDPLQEQGASHKGAEGEPAANPRDDMSEAGHGPDAARGSTPDSIGSSGSRKVSSGYDPQQQGAGGQPGTPQQPTPPQPQPQAQAQPAGPPASQPQPMYPPQQPGLYVQAEQATAQQPSTQPQQQAYPPQAFQQRYAPVVGPYPGVVPPQSQMMVAGSQQPQPGAYQNSYQGYPGVQHSYGGPQPTAGAVYRSGAPAQGPQPAHSFTPQEFSSQAAAAYSARFSQVAAQPPQQGPQAQSAAGNPYSKGGAYVRAPSQPSYQ